MNSASQIPQTPYKQDSVRPKRGKPPSADSRKSDSDRSDSLKQELLGALEDGKALETVVIHLPSESILADGMIIASGTSDRHLVSMAGKLQPILKQYGVRNSKIEGHPASGWVLLDAGDWIIHLFRPEIRKRYDLEGLWDLEGIWARATTEKDGEQEAEGMRVGEMGE